jgi:signal transduction histidine kinase
MTNPLVVALREARALVATASSGAAIAPGEAAVAWRLAREMDQTIARLEGNDPEKDLLSIVCHDLKDPLASIVMGAGFLRKTIPSDSAPTRRVVEAIARSADRMSQVVTDFHDLAKLECGRLPFEARGGDIVAIVRAALAPLATQAREHGVRLELETPEALAVVCDPARVTQIVNKLVGNAIKFTPSDGSITVRVEDGQGVVRLLVADTGRGISADRISTIFDRAANARRTPRDGPGLGLAIVKGLVELHAGTVAAENRVGGGSLFVVTLPVS